MLTQPHRTHATVKLEEKDEKCDFIYQLDGCIVWNAHNTVLGEEALLIYIVAQTTRKCSSSLIALVQL